MRIPFTIKCLAVVLAVMACSVLLWAQNHVSADDVLMLSAGADSRDEQTDGGAGSLQSSPPSVPEKPHPAQPTEADTAKPSEALPASDTQTDDNKSSSPPAVENARPAQTEGEEASGAASEKPSSPKADPQAPAVDSPPDETAEEAAADAAWTLEPEFTRPLMPIEPGHNDSNPVWSPSGDMLAFERSIGDQRKIVVARPNGNIVKTIYFQTPEKDGAMDFSFPGITDTASYNAGICWSGKDGRLVFMSNGGSGNYDLYLLPDLVHSQPQRLTRHHGKESHPHWSGAADRLVFVSGSTGKADIFTMDLNTRKTVQITRGAKMYHYPQWSPDGKRIAMIYGSNENHDIYLIENVADPFESTKALTTWPYDDLRPAWSPDGTKIAFYSNFNNHGDPKTWCLIVVDADGSGILTGEALTAGIVAHQVIPDIEQGPAWLPDSRHIAYVKNDEQAFNPIFLVNIDDRTPIAVQTRTRMNHDVTCSVDGTLAFRAQEEQWDHIYLAKIDPEMAVLEETE